MDNKLVVGVDIGGTHITASLIDIRNRKMLSNAPVRCEVDSSGTVEHVIRLWAETINSCCDNIPLEDRKVGIAMPGPVDYERGTCFIRDQHKYEHFYGLNLKDLLASALNISRQQILMINDAAGFLAGEVFSGAGQGHDTVLGLTLGTGLGSALQARGVVTDADLWHSPFQNGKAEDYLSGPWLVEEASLITGQRFRNVQELAAAAETRADVLKVFTQFGHNLGRFLIPQVRLHDVSVVVLGGNISRAHRLFLPALQEELRTAQTEVPVVIAKMGESAALVGAASLWERMVTA